MLVSATIAALAVSAGACVWPAPLNIESADAGVGSPPVVISSGPAPEFSLPGPIVLDRAIENQSISLTIRDVDVDEPTYVRMFVDYGMPDRKPFRVDCFIPGTGAIDRVGECNRLDAVCNDIEVGDETAHFLEAFVADHDFLDESQRPDDQQPYRGLPPGAGFSVRTWSVICVGEEPGEL